MASAKHQYGAGTLLGLLFIVAFLTVLPKVGITQWALVNRLIGCYFLLGYLSFGALIMRYIGTTRDTSVL